jgi:hypothetical protein
MLLLLLLPVPSHSFLLILLLSLLGFLQLVLEFLDPLTLLESFRVVVTTLPTPCCFLFGFILAQVLSTEPGITKPTTTSLTFLLNPKLRLLLFPQPLFFRLLPFALLLLPFPFLLLDPSLLFFA